MPVLPIGTDIGGLAGAFRQGQRDVIELNKAREQAKARRLFSQFLDNSSFTQFPQEIQEILSAEGVDPMTRVGLANTFSQLMNRQQQLSNQQQIFERTAPEAVLQNKLRERRALSGLENELDPNRRTMSDLNVKRLQVQIDSLDPQKKLEYELERLKRIDALGLNDQEKELLAQRIALLEQQLYNALPENQISIFEQKEGIRSRMTPYQELEEKANTLLLQQIVDSLIGEKDAP